MGAPVLSLGLVNVFLNAVIWIIHELVQRLMMRFYALVTTFKFKRTGLTRATDSTDVLIQNIFIAACRERKRPGPKWAVLIALILALMFPCELMFEFGIKEFHNCAAEERLSIGICATPWHGHSEVSIAAAALMTQRYEWIDYEWEALMEGASKEPVANEARKAFTIKRGRRIVLSNCGVNVRQKLKESPGYYTIHRSGGPYDTVVVNATNLGKYNFARGDVTFDGAMGLAFTFWNGTQEYASADATAKWMINIYGMETVLSRTEIDKVRLGSYKPWVLKAEKSRTRLYKITCDTDGVLPKDLAMATSLYRTAQMDQLGIKRTNVSYRIERLAPLTSSDLYKSLYAMKAEDEMDNCQGTIDFYRACGGVEHWKMAPFILLSTALTLMWVIAGIFLRNISFQVPHSAATWRRAAFLQLKAMNTLQGNKSNREYSKKCEQLSFDLEAGQAFCIIPEAHTLLWENQNVVVVPVEQNKQLGLLPKQFAHGVVESELEKALSGKPSDAKGPKSDRNKHDPEV